MNLKGLTNMNDTISIKKTGKQILVFLFFLFLIFFFLLKVNRYA